MPESAQRCRTWARGRAVRVVRRAVAVVLLLCCVGAGTGALPAGVGDSAGVGVARAVPQAPGDPPVLPSAPASSQPGAPGPNRGTDRSAPAGPTSSSTPLWGELGAGHLVVMIIAVLVAAVWFAALASMLHAWWVPRQGPRRPDHDQDPDFSFSVLVWAHHDAAALNGTLDALARFDHPLFEVIVVVGHDDPTMSAVGLAAAQRHPGIVRVVTDERAPASESAAMAIALPHCQGDVIGVVHAADDVHPGLLDVVDRRMAETGADVVLAGAQAMYPHTSWWSLRNCLDHFFWYRSRLPQHAGAELIPTGGVSVFVRSAVLREAGGWDGDCLDAPCDLGVRLAVLGRTVAVADDLEVATRRQAPRTVADLVRQRTRWNRGAIQVFGKGDWRRLTGAGRRLGAAYLLVAPFLGVAVAALIPLVVVIVGRFGAPVPVVLALLLPLGAAVLTVVVECAALGDFGRSWRVDVRWRDYLRLLIGIVPYRLLLTGSVVWAIAGQLHDTTLMARRHRSA